ncbi:MAG: amino-acid N-acetyltransferase [Gammaproteobacteria bacterium]|jgi:amino-acid N-acetyltransferase
MNIFPHPPRDRALQLLVECDLPWGDLKASSLEYFLGCGDESAPNGIIGLERHGKDALLRSLAVSADCRQSGCGKAPVSRLEELAQSNGVRELYLLTTTAEAFFSRLGCRSVTRTAVPNHIKATTQFSSLCPDDATVM